MANINDIYSSGGEYLKADEIRKGDGSFARFDCVIEAVEIKNMASEGKPAEMKAVLSLSGKDKRVVVNKTNGLTIASAYGLETDNWPGKPITVTGHMVNFQGQVTNGIKIEIPQHAPIPQQEVAAANVPVADNYDIPF